MRPWFLIAVLLPCADLLARAYPLPYDALGGVRAWETLTQEQKHYRILAVEPFDGRPYRPYAPSTELADLQYLFSTPDEPAFTEEVSMVERAGVVSQGGQSLLMMTAFTAPGKQIFQFRPLEPVRIVGQPYRLSVWVNSQEYRHRLEFLFRNADGQRIHVDAGRLYWKGWRRLDITLPAELHRLGRRIRFRTGALFEGIVVYSHPQADPGAVSLQFDHLLIMSDFSGLQYPGGELVDEW